MFVAYKYIETKNINSKQDVLNISKSELSSPIIIPKINIEINKENNEVLNVRIAGYSIRILSFLIDSVFIFSYFVIIYFIAINFIDPQFSSVKDIVILLIVLGSLYEVIFWTWKKATLGQLLLELRVIRTNGENVNVFIAFVRRIFYAFWPMNIFYILNDKKQCFHDHVANTYVIYRDEKKLKLQHKKWLLVLIVTICIFSIGLITMDKIAVINYELKGIKEFDLKNYKKAITYFDKAINIDSKNGDIFVERGITKLKRGDVKGACVDLLKSSELQNKYLKIEDKEKINQACEVMSKHICPFFI